MCVCDDKGGMSTEHGDNLLASSMSEMGTRDKQEYISCRDEMHEDNCFDDRR